jgi:hypothetical protein
MTTYACKDQVFHGQIKATVVGDFLVPNPGAWTPINTSISPLPGWMSVSANANTTFISGTPTTLGAVNFTVSGVAAAPGKGDPGAYGKKDYTINVVGIATASPLPDADIHAPGNVAYSVSLDASSIPGALSWSQTGMPGWLNFNNVTGALYGNPTVVGTSSFTMTVTNGTVTCSKNFTLTVKDTAGPFWNIVWTKLLSAGNLNTWPPNNTVLYESSYLNVANNFASFGGNYTGPNTVAPPNYTGTFYVGALGTLTYTGPAIQCKATYHLNSSFPVGAPARSLYISNVVPAVNSTNVMVSGDNVFLFSILISVNRVIQIFGNIQNSPYWLAQTMSNNLSYEKSCSGTLLLEVVIP